MYNSLWCCIPFVFCYSGKRFIILSFLLGFSAEPWLVLQPSPLRKPTLTWWGGLSNQEVLPSAWKSRACQSNATTFNQNKQISAKDLIQSGRIQIGVATLSLVSSCHLLVCWLTNLYPILIHFILSWNHTSYCFPSSCSWAGFLSLEVKYDIFRKWRKVLGRSTQTDTHTITSFVTGTTQVCLIHFADGRSLHSGRERGREGGREGERDKHKHKHTHKHTHTHTHTHTH